MHNSSILKINFVFCLLDLVIRGNLASFQSLKCEYFLVSTWPLQVWKKHWMLWGLINRFLTVFFVFSFSTDEQRPAPGLLQGLPERRGDPPPAPRLPRVTRLPRPDAPGRVRLRCEEFGG